MRHLTIQDFGFDRDRGTPVVSSARKFVIPVPAFGGTGLTFFNAKDASWQSVAGDGEGVIIVNEVTPEQGARITQRMRARSRDPAMLTEEQLNDVLREIREQLGLTDIYNSTRPFVETNMQRVSGSDDLSAEEQRETFGLYARRVQDIGRAVYVSEPFSFAGPAGTPQQFPNGGVIVQQAGGIRGVQPDVFSRTYRLADGRSIELDRLRFTIESCRADAPSG